MSVLVAPILPPSRLVALAVHSPSGFHKQTQQWQSHQLSCTQLALQAQAPLSKIKNNALDQYGTEPIGQQQFGTAGIKGVNYPAVKKAMFFVCLSVCEQHYVKSFQAIFTKPRRLQTTIMERIPSILGLILLRFLL